MTVPATPRRAGPFNGNGVTTSFPFTFKVFSDEDIRVVLADTDGVETTLVLDSTYSVTLNGDQDASPGGTITYPLSGDPLATSETLTVVGNESYTQELDLPSGGNFSPRALENALDRMTFQIQQLAEGLGRALTLPVSAVGADTQLPTPEANRVIGWSAAANALVNYAPTDLATVVVSGTGYTDVFDGTGVQTAFTLTANPGSVHALDVSISGVVQVNGVDFSVSGVTLTFTTAPPPGTGNVVARYVTALPVDTSPSSSSFTLDSVAELRAVERYTGGGVFVRGYYAPGDGGGGDYWYDASDTTSADNGGTIIVAADGGRWKLALTGAVSVMQFGAKGDGLHDDADAFNAATLWCLAYGGAKLRIPAPPVQYITHTTWTVDMSAVTGDLSKLHVNIEGDGQAVTKIVTDATPFMNVIGGAYNTEGINAYFRISGLLVQFVGAPTHPGCQITESAYIEFEDCQFYGFSVGIAATNVLVATFRRVNLRGNTTGITIAPIGIHQKNPNAVWFDGCVIAGNSNLGMQITKPGNVALTSCTVEFNGTIGNSATGALEFLFPGAEATAAVTLRNCYFEVNAGGFDVHITHGNVLATYTISDCNFNRTDGVRYTTNNILVDQATSYFMLNLDGSGFQHYSSYTPNSARKYVKINSTSMFGYLIRDELAMFASSVETSLYDGNRHQNLLSRPAAWCRFDGTVAGVSFPVQGHNVNSITRNGPGDYTVRYNAVLGNNNTAWSVLSNGTRLVPSLITDGNTETRFRLETTAGVATDASAVSIVVWGA